MNRCTFAGMAMLISLPAATAIAEGFPVSAPAGGVAYVGIPAEELYGLVSAQRTPTWCWAACIQTALRHHGLEVAQEDIVARACGVAGFRNTPFAGARAEAINASFGDWSADRRGVPFRILAKLVRGPATPEELVAHLAHKRPILMAYGPDPENGHVVLVTAVSYFRDAAGTTHIASIVVRDPFPDKRNVRSGGRREYPNGTLPDPVQWMWLLEVNRK